MQYHGADYTANVWDTFLFENIGAAIGAGGSDFIKGGNIINDAMQSFGKAIKKGVHPTVKKADKKTVKKAARYVVKSFGMASFETFIYGGIYEFSSFYANAMVDRVFGR